MLEITIDKQDQARINVALASLDPESSESSILAGIKKGSLIAVKALVENLSGPILKKRSGNLAASIGMHIEQGSGEITGVVGSGGQSEMPAHIEGGEDEKVDPMYRMIYANILENGGQIVPGPGKKALAIPIGQALSPSGVARFTAQQLKDGLVGNYEGSVIINGIIYGINGNRRLENQLTPLFVLKASVDIPGFQYMAQTIQETEDEIVKALVEEIEKGLNKK